MWVYRANNGAFEVGYYLPDRTWFCDGAFTTTDAAAERAHYLNGGNA